MRGKRQVCPAVVLACRNIPAYAGKTGPLPQVAPTTTGTSPRMRGKPFRPATAAQGRGNIPAYAGKTLQSRGVNKRKPEHPRVCGENVANLRNNVR